ncbi:MAG: aminopeptidase P family N-terminal domain-containing protein, partial [bacterium]
MDENRIARVREKMRAAGLRQLLISDPTSIGYLTGVAVEPGERFFALLLREEGEPLLFLNRLFSSDTALRILWLRDTDDVAALVAKELLP